MPTAAASHSPVLAAAARKRKLAALVRDDNPQDQTLLTASSWVALSRDPRQLEECRKRLENLRGFLAGMSKMFEAVLRFGGAGIADHREDRGRLEAAGADIGEIQQLGDEWSLFFRDVDGTELEVCTPV